MNCVKQRWTRCGFTLIELLVVVATIAVLIAILLPCLSAAKRSAKRAGCSARLRQIALAWTAYLDDYQGTFYKGVNTNLTYGGWRGAYQWVRRPLNRYASLSDDPCESDAKIFCCPADRGGVPSRRLWETSHRVNGTSYQTNRYLVGQDHCSVFNDQTAPLDEQISQRLPGMNRSQVVNPSRLLLIGDYGWVNQWIPPENPYRAYKEQAEWHGRTDSHNMAFLDGHVGFLKIRKGIYVSDDYAVLPFKELYPLAHEIQAGE
jgi:prepilin-type N-terminal cleavage/methylation domain-containing protein/prepilin-type processing-associated H-X9-DG protein